MKPIDCISYRVRIPPPLSKCPFCVDLNFDNKPTINCLRGEIAVLTEDAELCTYQDWLICPLNEYSKNGKKFKTMRRIPVDGYKHFKKSPS